MDLNVFSGPRLIGMNRENAHGVDFVAYRATPILNEAGQQKLNYVYLANCGADRCRVLSKTEQHFSTRRGVSTSPPFAHYCRRCLHLLVEIRRRQPLERIIGRHSASDA